MTPEERAREVLATQRAAFHSRRTRPTPLDYAVADEALDALAAAGLRVVAEGHAVIDGYVVELCARCGHDEWWHSITGEGFCVDACGCHGFVARGGAPDTEGRRDG